MLKEMPPPTSPTVEAVENMENELDLVDVDNFDFDAFFDQTEEPVNEETAQSQPVAAETVSTPAAQQPKISRQVLINKLQKSSARSVANFTARVTAETFSIGASLTSNFFSVLGTVIGSCGPLCGHVLGAISGGGAGFSFSTPGMGLGGGHGHHHNHEHEHDEPSKKSQKVTPLFPTQPSSRSTVKNSDSLINQQHNKFGEDSGYLLGIGLFGALLDGLLPGGEAAA